MSTVREELEQFHRYAAARLDHGSSELSLDDLYDEWSNAQSRDEINKAVQQGLADFEAGRHEDAFEATLAIRKELGLTKP